MGNGLQLTTAALPARSRGGCVDLDHPRPGRDSPAALALRLAADDAQRAIAACGATPTRRAWSRRIVFGRVPFAGERLLRGRRVTTSWWLAPELRRIEPACSVDAGPHGLCRWAG
jgi:hypothetical protein